jgi:hypothetical protein
MHNFQQSGVPLKAGEKRGIAQIPTVAEYGVPLFAACGNNIQSRVVVADRGAGAIGAHTEA